MKRYKVKIEPEALADIQEITNWYNEAQAGLGKRFQKTAIKHINSLNKDPSDLHHSLQRNTLCFG